MEGDYDMSAEKYVKDIVGRIKCGSIKKKEIETQLLSDISMRIEQGETLEEIIQSMGSPQEIADAFSQDMPENERKAYRNKKIGMIVTAVVLGVVLLSAYVWWTVPKPYAIENNALLSKETVGAKVEETVSLLDANDFGTLQAEAVDELRNVLTQEMIDKVRIPMSDDWGERLSIGTTYMQGIKQKGKVLVVTQTDVMYENISVVYTITFDENLNLAGLYMR